jgi:DNA-binding transcriptional ArsR family regulator
MVEYKSDQLDSIFHALADPTRREMVRQLATQERTVSELAEPFNMSLAAASKHIKVLEGAGLLRRRVRGRTHHCRLNPEALAIVREWVRFYERFWTIQLDALERELEKAEEEIESREANVGDERDGDTI